jgi:hypothetical protein
MTDLDRLHELSRMLTALTAPGKQEPSLATWSLTVGKIWGDIARMWEDDPKRAAAPDLYHALEIVTECLNAGSSFDEAIAEARAALLKANPEREGALDCFAPPMKTAPQHDFAAVEGNRFCGKCGGGSLHPIHIPAVRTAVTCTDCKQEAGTQHKPSCHRQGIVTSDSDYLRRPRE